MGKKRIKSAGYDFLIIGAGGTGLAGAMYAARLGLKTLVLGKSNGSELPVGGVITTTDSVENYPGFSKISGFELAKKIEEHAREYPLVSIKEEEAIKIKKESGGFSVDTDKGKYKAKAVLFATGTKWRKLDVPGSAEFERRGVHYCALCDGPLFRNKIVAVVGGSDSAVKDALLLSKYAEKIYILARGSIHPEPITLKRAKENKKLEMIEDINVREIRGEESVKSIALDRSYKGKNELRVDGVFIAIGHIPMSGLAKTLGVKVDNKSEIIINHETAETNIPGVFAAGDVTNKEFKQLITGVSDGCTAAYYAHEFIMKKK